MTLLLGPSGAVWCGWGAAALLRDHGEDDAQLVWGLLPLCNVLCFPSLLIRDRTAGFTLCLPWSPGSEKHYRAGRADVRQ